LHFKTHFKKKKNLINISYNSRFTVKTHVLERVNEKEIIFFCFLFVSELYKNIEEKTLKRKRFIRNFLMKARLF